MEWKGSIGKEREESLMIGQFIVDEDGEKVQCIPVDNNLNNSDSIQANENRELNFRGKRGTRWADDGSMSQIDKMYVDFIIIIFIIYRIKQSIESRRRIKNK